MATYIASLATVLETTEIPQEYSRQLRRADPFISYSVTALHGLLNNSSQQISDNCGLVICSGFGPMETNFEVLDQVVEKEQTSPTLFSHSVFNAAAGYLTRIFKLHHTAFTLTDFTFPFFQGLEKAIHGVESGLFDSCLVLQTETYSQLLNDGRFLAEENSHLWPPGSCGWLISGNKHEGLHRIKDFSLNCFVPKSNEIFSEQLFYNDTTIELKHPLEAPQTITKILKESRAENHSLSLQSSHGKIDLTVTSQTL